MPTRVTGIRLKKSAVDPTAQLAQDDEAGADSESGDEVRLTYMLTCLLHFTYLIM